MHRSGKPAGAGPASNADLPARWTVRFVAVALFGVVIATVLTLSLLSLDQDGSSPLAREGRRAGAGPVAVEDLGPEPGVDLAGYTQNRRAALAAAAGDLVAVASLAAYADGAQAWNLVGSLSVVALLVAAPEMSPAVVVGDLGAWANAQTASIREERDEIRKLIPTVTDAAFKEFYTSEVDRLDQAANALSPSAAIVFGVVVRGPAPALQALGVRPEVRLVDVAEGSEPASSATYRGVRPEEKVSANDPPTRPA